MIRFFDKLRRRRGRGRSKKKVLSSVVHPLVSKENLRKSVKDIDNKGKEGETIEDGEEEAKSKTLEGKPSQEMITDVTEEIEKKNYRLMSSAVIMYQLMGWRLNLWLPKSWREKLKWKLMTRMLNQREFSRKIPS